MEEVYEVTKAQHGWIVVERIAACAGPALAFCIIQAALASRLESCILRVVLVL
jgi:hypothetical protein